MGRVWHKEIKKSKFFPLPDKDHHLFEMLGHHLLFHILRDCYTPLMSKNIGKKEKK